MRHGRRRYLKTVEPAYFIGVDGGGSSCRVRVRDRDLQLLGAAEAGAANVYLDFDGALRTIVEAIASALGTAGLGREAFRAASVGLGLAGVSSPLIARRVEAALDEFHAVVVSHDGVTACLGAHGGRDGGLVIAGTGSAAVLRLGGRIASIGGRGFLLGDDGSGAWIGRAVWRRALRVADGLEPGSRLLRGLLAEFGDDPVAVIAWGRTAPSHAFAAYAPLVFAAAAQDDPPALAVAREAAGFIAELITALHRHGAPRISLVGGMAEALAPYLPAPVAALLEPPLADALEGALLLARQPDLLSVAPGPGPWHGD